MSYRDYYPEGAADDPKAPYNECINPDREFDIRVSYELFRTEGILTDCYNLERDEDEDGSWERCVIDPDDKVRILEKESTIMPLDKVLNELILLCDQKIEDGNTPLVKVAHYRYLKSEAQEWKNSIVESSIEIE